MSQKRYDEYYARRMLLEFLPERFSELKISDKPDLRDSENKIGIEVVNAIPPKGKETIELAGKILKNTIRDIESAKKVIKRNGSELTEFGLNHKPTTYCLDTLEGSPYGIIKEKYEEKAGKIQGYDPLERYDLFIYTECFFEEELFYLLLRSIRETISSERDYTFLYIQMLNYLIVVDVNTMMYQKIELGKRVWGISEQALEDMTKGE